MPIALRATMPMVVPARVAAATFSIMRWRVAVGIGLLAAGCLFLLLSFAGMPWYRAGNGPYAPPYDGGRAPRTFADLRVHFSIPGTGHEGAVYFGWLWWVLIVALVIIGIFGAVGARWRGARWVSIGLGSFGALWTYTSFNDIVETGGSITQRADAGVWAAITGYMLAAIGALIAQPDSSHRREVVRDSRDSHSATSDAA